MIVKSLCMGTFASLYGDVSFEERSLRLIGSYVAMQGAFASLYGDVATLSFKSFDGAFASLIDIYGAMQRNARSFVWRCIIR